MPRKLSDKQLFKLKNDWLRMNYEQVTPMEFYRDVFPEGSFEREGHPEDQKANGILSVITDNGEKAQNFVVFDDLRQIEEMKGKEFVVMSPISYSGRNRTARNARYMYGIAIDLDGVEMPQLRDVFFQMKNGVIPRCTYCINSGHGLHLYYLLNDPVPLYRTRQEQYKDWKYELTYLIWNRYTSTYTERDEVQYQGIFQGFRMPGTQTKLGRRYIVTAFKTGDRVSIDYLNGFVYNKEKAVTGTEYETHLSLDEARRKFPEWYDRRIVNGEPRGRWHVKRDLYDWWLKKLQLGIGVNVGHRYSCLAVLAAYAAKCDIAEEELRDDAMRLLPPLDSISDDDHNRFTSQDVRDALKLYNESYVYYSRREAERVSGIAIPSNKRNHQKQADHLEEARAIRDIRQRRKSTKWTDGNGRPKGRSRQRDEIEAYQATHPGAKPKDCIADTGISKNTVYRWWKA